MTLIECKNLTLGYEGRVIAEELTFSVKKGDYLCIVGENGAGKSTLIKALLKLNPPLNGEIAIADGLDGGIGYLPQQTEVQRDFPASVKEIVLSGCLKGKKMGIFYSAEQKQLALANMKKTGIEKLANKSYRELSGGQQQRVLLARALCASQKILLLDEPATGLDPVATAEMYGEIEKLNKEMGITVVMVSHDIKAAVKNSTHILHISHKPLFFGTTRAYMESRIGRAFLGEDERGEA